MEGSYTSSELVSCSLTSAALPTGAPINAVRASPATTGDITVTSSETTLVPMRCYTRSGRFNPF